MIFLLKKLLNLQEKVISAKGLINPQKNFRLRRHLSAQLF